VHFNDGALVNKGDLLITIDQRPFRAAVDRAAAELAAARARSTYASSDATRAERLLADHAIAIRENDQIQNAAREALANVLSAQAALEAAEVNLSYTRILAPVAGRASSRRVDSGQRSVHGCQCSRFDYGRVDLADLRILRCR